MLSPSELLALNRRQFATASASMLALTQSQLNPLSAAVAASRPVIGMIGCGGRSKNLLEGFRKAAEIAWVCDPDQERLDRMQKLSNAPHQTSDLRRVLEDTSVNAVVIATPDHWHAPAAILACDAGKHVYVEKPCSHNVREGRMLIEAARRNNVVVQHGTQSRSNPLIVRAIELLREGAIGDVLMAKAWNVQRRKSIGHEQPTPSPTTLDYDTWVGPAMWLPYQENRLHYNWHWWHNFGTGDLGNDGTHELDIARWGLGVEGLPTSVNAMGGKYNFDDDQEFPDTATCSFEWPGDGGVGSRKQLLFEMRLWSTSYPHNCDTGIEFYGTEGLLFVSKRGKLQMWNASNQSVLIDDLAPKATLPSSHQVDFLEAISEGRPPSADIEIGHASASLAHLANISVRVQRSLKLNPNTETILDDKLANELLGRPYRKDGHWSIPKVT
ncbi:MAG: Gfo/Idh/MocA family oxidoreductase [Pirellulaceae bacterium]|nr:Gfo/Idh/MocA family oxidoreductase [Pirellulaceae bacterium]